MSETFEIALKSNVAAVAAKDAAALDALLASADKAKGALAAGNTGKSAELAQVKAVSAEMAQQAALAAKLATFDAGRAKSAADLKSKLKSLNDDASGKTAADAQKKADKAALDAKKLRIADGGGFASGGKKVDKILGLDESQGFEALAAKIGPAGLAAGAAVAAGGAVVLAAAAALAAAAGKLIFAAVQYGVEQTAAAEKQKAILDKLTGGKGAVTFDLALSLAGETGTDPATAIEKVKGLIASKFTGAQIPLQFKASADIAAVKGEGAGAAYLAEMEKIANLTHADERALKGLANAGVDTRLVLQQLAKKGESLASVEARLKKGTVASQEFTAAAAKAAEIQFGGVAGKGLDASVNRIKIAIQKLFTGLNLSPLTGAIDKVAKVLDGPAGEKLKTAFSHLGDAALKTLFGPFEGAEGQKRLEKIATTLAVIVEKTATILEKAAPIIEKALDLLFDTGKKDPSGLAAKLDVLIGLGMAAQGLTLLDFDEIAAGFDRITAAVAGLLGVDISPAAGLGTGIVDGMIGGILSGAAGVVAAIESVVGGAITSAKTMLQQHSPSKVFADIGAYTTLGFAQGVTSESGAANDATASMASDATGSATSAAAGGSGGGASGGGTISISISVTASGSGSADAQATAIADALEPKVQAIVRKVQRNMGEQGASLTTRAA